MQGIAARPGQVEPCFVDVPEPGDPGPGEVLCCTLELGVCGTDREILQSSQPLVPPGSDYLVLGHECLARVAAVGSGVRELGVGDLVVPVVRRPRRPGTLRPDMLAMGEYVERGIVEQHGFSTRWWTDRPEHLFRVGPELAPWAVLAEPLTCSEKGVNEALLLQQARLGETCWTDEPPRVLITGLGPIGLGAALVCCCRGWPTTVYGRDPRDSYRATLVEAMGASYWPASEADFEPADVQRDGFDLLLECTGSDELMVEVAGVLRARGIMVWLGSTRRPRPTPLNLSTLMRNSLLRNHLILGSVNAADRDFRNVLDHLDRLRQEMPQVLDRMITARVSPDDSLWHYEHRAPQGIKTVVSFD